MLKRGRGGRGGQAFVVVWGLHRHLWLVVRGPCLPCVVLGACHRSWMVLLGARGWRCWGLITLFVGGVPSPRHFWVVVVVHPHRFSCTMDVALVTVVVVLSPFEGEGGGWSFMFAGTPSIIVVIVVQHHFCVLSLHVVLIVCPCCCCVSSLCCCLVPSSLLSRVVVVAVPSLWHVIWLHNVAPVLERWLGGGGELTHLGSSLPVSAHGCWSSFMTRGGWLWFIFVCGQPSSFGGGQLRFLGSCGGGAVIGGHWCLWAIMRAVVVKSMVGGIDEHGWWWWEEEMVVVGRKWLPNKHWHCLFVWEGISHAQIHTWDHHMYDLIIHVMILDWSHGNPIIHVMILDWSHGNPPDVPQNSIFFSWTQVRLCMELLCLVS